MASHDTSLRGPAAFPSTSWSLVAAAADKDDPAWRGHLERLILQYWRPAYSYIRACAHLDREDAKDLTQEFFARILEKNVLGRADRQRGSFRAFLRTALKNLAVDDLRRRRAPKRALLFRFDETRDADPAATPPQEVFEAEWKRAVLWGALEELERRMRRDGLDRYYEVFRAYCLPDSADRKPDLTYGTLAQRLGVSEAVVRKRLSRCRRELREILRGRIRDYVRDEREADDEFREIVRS